MTKKWLLASVFILIVFSIVVLRNTSLLKGQFEIVDFGSTAEQFLDFNHYFFPTEVEEAGVIIDDPNKTQGDQLPFDPHYTICGDGVVQGSEECDGKPYCTENCQFDVKPLGNKNVPLVFLFPEIIDRVTLDKEVQFPDDTTLQYEFTLRPQYTGKVSKISYEYDDPSKREVHEVKSVNGRFLYTETINKSKLSFGPSFFTVWFTDGTKKAFGQDVGLPIHRTNFNRSDAVYYETNNTIVIADKRLAKVTKQQTLNEGLCYSSVRAYFPKNMRTKRYYLLYIDNLNDGYTSHAKYGKEKDMLAVFSPDYGFHKKCEHTIAHELVHAFVDRMPIEGYFNEGLADYIADQMAYNAGKLECYADGFDLKNGLGKLPYERLSTTRDSYGYPTGNCMYRYLIKQHGKKVLTDIIQRLQDLSDKGISAGVCGKYYKSFLEDVLIPVLGKNSPSIPVIKKRFGVDPGSC